MMWEDIKKNILELFFNTNFLFLVLRYHPYFIPEISLIANLMYLGQCS